MTNEAGLRFPRDSAGLECSQLLTKDQWMGLTFVLGHLWSSSRPTRTPGSHVTTAGRRGTISAWPKGNSYPLLGFTTVAEIFHFRWEASLDILCVFFFRDFIPEIFPLYWAPRQDLKSWHQPRNKDVKDALIDLVHSFTRQIIVELLLRAWYCLGGRGHESEGVWHSPYANEGTNK